MSKKDLIRLNVIEQFRHGELSRFDTALKLNISERTVTRLASKVREKGIIGIIHGNLGKEPSNKLGSELINKYVIVYKEKYSKFNYRHALEMIEKHEEFPPISYNRFVKACRSVGIGKVKKRRTSKARLARERYSQEGYLWQMDGSPEKWNGEDTWSLIGLIDDATSKVPGAILAKSETTWDCMNLVKSAILTHGIPEFILTDRAGWSTNEGKRGEFTQFQRACSELGITVIGTSTPESKGRVERMNRTFQDRLIPELDLYKITSKTHANMYLKNVFIPEWNDKFTVSAALETTRYRPVPVTTNLDDVFCKKYKRVVNKNHTINFEGRLIKIFPQEGRNYYKKEVTINQQENKTIEIFYGNLKLDSAEYTKATKKHWKLAS